MGYPVGMSNPNPEKEEDDKVTGEIEVNKCSFCGQSKPVTRLYVHAKNTQKTGNGFAIIYYCKDCGLKCLSDAEEIERLRVQLAGCGVAALGYSSGGNKAKKGDYGWSPAYQDTLELRKKYEKLLHKGEGEK